MISPLPTTPPLPLTKKTPPRHNSSASRIQEDDGEGSILNRMREVVLTHYRNSPSAPDRPIDLTHFKESSTTLTTGTSLSANSASQSSASSMLREPPPSIPMPTRANAVDDEEDDDDEEEYVPPGLADFVANVNRELEQQQNAFLNDPSNLNVVNRVDTEDVFYLEDRTFETAPTDEHNDTNTDDESTKVALKKNILQRCDLLQLDVAMSDDHEEYIGIYSNRIDHAFTWSPDIFTSPTPINPASLLTDSQVKYQVFTSPNMTPIPAPPKHGSQADNNGMRLSSKIHEEPQTSPLHSLPQFSLSGTNRSTKTTPAEPKELGVQAPNRNHLPHSLENSPIMMKAEPKGLFVDPPSSADQQVLLMDEPTKPPQFQPNPVPSPFHVNRLDVFVNKDEEDLAQQPNVATESLSQDTPSTLSMASPSKGMLDKIKHIFSQTSGHRASSPIYGYAPSPEYNTGMISGLALAHPPSPLHDPTNQHDVQGLSTRSNMSSAQEPVSEVMAHREPQSPSAGSLLQRATKRLQSASLCDESETKSIGLNSIESGHQRSRQIVRTSSLDEKKTTAPSPKQKFTNRPPQNKPISTPSPLPTGNSITKAGHEIQRNPHNRLSASSSFNKNCASPPKISLSPSLAVSETPSPLSMSSPGGYDTRSAFVPSSRKSDKKVGASQVPRFRTPPSPPRVKTAPRFTAEAAERLSRSSKSPQPPLRRSVPHYASPLKKSVKSEKSVKSDPSVVVRSQGMSMSPMISPPVCNRESIKLNLTTNASTKKTSISSINRLAAPSSTESRRRSVVTHDTASELGNPTKKQLTSPLFMPSSSNEPKAKAKNSRSSPTSRRRTAERILRSKSKKIVGRTSPRIPSSHQSTCKPTERNLSIDASHDKSVPANDSQSTPSYKLSNGFEKSFRLSVSTKMQDKSHTVVPITNDSLKSKHSDVIDRLSRPTKARAIAINCTLHPPPPEEGSEEQIPVVSSRSPSPFILTTVERLTKPTIARKAAMQALGRTPHLPPMSSRSSVVGKEPRLPREKSSASSNSSNQSPKLPSRLDSSSHLLKGTAVSIAKNTHPKKAAVRPPTPTRFVSGASDRLTKPTASYRAAMLSRTSDAIPSQVPSGKNNLANANKLQPNERRSVSTVGRSLHLPTRALTVPRGPRCANIFPSKKQECIEPPSLAQVLNTFGKGLRDDYSVGSAGSNFSRRSLTIPTGPTLATDIRGGEKYKPPKVNSDVTLADSNTVLQNGLRSPYHSKQSGQRKGPTIPISPKFTALPSREPPKSSSDLEAEEMDFFKGHQFKAKPPLHSTLHRSSTVVSRHPSNEIPGFMRPTKAAALNSRELVHSSKVRTHAAVTTNKSSSRTLVSRHRNVGLPNSIVTNNLGFAQRVLIPDDGLKDLVMHAARAAKALAIREEARQEKLAQEEFERRELATFKAKPIPRTTYEFNAIVPTSTAPLVEPFSPELHTKQRMKERKVFDEYAEQERLSRMERERTMEVMLRADEDEDINERRRLPVSEGGMIPVAAPVNAVLCNE